MTLASALARGRQAAEARMTDACTITRAVRGTMNNSSGTIPETTTVIYEGRCRVKMTDSEAGLAQAGGQQVVQQSLALVVPVSVTDVQPGDIATITAAAFDPALVGKTLRVRDFPYSSQATSRRIRCEDEQT